MITPKPQPQPRTWALFFAICVVLTIVMNIGHMIIDMFSAPRSLLNIRLRWVLWIGAVLVLFFYK
jgi:hypothetical protein